MTKQLLYFIIFISLSLTQTSYAQLQLNGIVDLEISSGGKESRFLDNGIPKDFRNAQLNIAQVSLIGFAPLSEKFFAESRLTIFTDGSGELSNVSVQLATISYNANENLTLTAGRFITPYGIYAQDQLVIDRPFVEHPLSYTYVNNISSFLGLVTPGFREDYIYSQEVRSFRNTLFYGGYSTGLKFDWDAKPNNRLNISGALTNQAISDYKTSNLPSLAGTIRVSGSPSPYIELGVSASHGSFFESEARNQPFQATQDFSDYRQTILGGHFRWQFTYFEITGEATYSNWETPLWVAGTFVQDATTNELLDTRVSNLGTNMDIKYEPPFWTGGYFAFRADRLTFFDADNPVTGQSFEWDEDFWRLTGAVGYKFAPNVVGKIVFADQDEFNLDQYSLRIYLTAAF